MEFGPEVTGKDKTTKMLLNDQDKVMSCKIKISQVTCIFSRMKGEELTIGC